jgi:hypothetical protein
MHAALPLISNRTPGCDLGRAGGRYFSNFDWHQSYVQNINFSLAAQA